MTHHQSLEFAVDEGIGLVDVPLRSEDLDNKKK